MGGEGGYAVRLGSTRRMLTYLFLYGKMFCIIYLIAVGVFEMIQI